MSRLDKTVISIQIGKTTEEQVRFQSENLYHLFTSGSKRFQARVQSSRPVSHRVGRKAGYLGLRGGSLDCEQFSGSVNFDHLLFYMCLIVNMPSLKGDWLNLSKDFCCQGGDFRWCNNFCQFDLVPLS